MGEMDFSTLFEGYRSAVFDKDVARLTALYGENIIAFDAWTPWSYQGKAAWHGMNHDWLSSLGSESVVVAFEDIHVVQSESVAVAYATVAYTAVSEAGEKLRSMKNRLTWVAEQDGGVWKIVHQHTSVPIDGQSMSPVLHP